MDFFEASLSDWHRKQPALIEAANNSPKGIDADAIVPGAIVTISPNKATGDRSWTNEIWEVVAVLHGRVALKAIWGCNWLDKPIMVQMAEHEFYAAEDFAQAVLAASEARA